MKIVVNKCYGGFGLSHEGMMMYARQKGMIIYAYVEKWSVDLYSKLPHNSQSKEVLRWPIKDFKNDNGVPIIYYSLNPNAETTEEIYADDQNIYDGDFERNDPILVAVVEKLGEKASGVCAKLEVVEIPDDVEWWVEEYDGSEWIAEKHRTW